MANASLQRANKEKNDEFYTQLADIENELKHYKEHFKDKAVFCNCDDPYESNFVKYFAMNFNLLGLKKLIDTCDCGKDFDIGRMEAHHKVRWVDGGHTARDNCVVLCRECRDRRHGRD